MKNISDYLKDPTWWFSAVILALALNVLSGYIKDMLDRAFSNFSAKRRAVRLANNAHLQVMVTEIRSSPDKELLFIATESTLGRKELEWFCMMLLTFGISDYMTSGMGSIFFFLMGSFAVLLSFSYSRRRRFIHDALVAAESVYTRYGA